MKVISLFVIISSLFIFSGSTLAADGGKIFTEKCSMCHGPKGAGTPMGPAIKGNEYVTKGNADDIRKVILEGRTGSYKKYPKISIDMPKMQMPDADVSALISFMQGDLQK